ncbi:MAG: hypothetical protein HDR36_05635 [Treponema sp.]|nr:hypothetical protein [Treponema sp.]MBD5437419.1 hypothetical protein [Treponema sp.]
MNKRIYFIFIAASFALLVSAPGRLAYGLVLIVEMNLLVLASASFAAFVRRFEFGNLRKVVMLSFVIFATVLFRQILILFSPVIALTLGFVIFLPPVSVFLFGNVFAERTPIPSDALRQSLVFSAFALVFFFLRDLLGFGTISFPLPNGIGEARFFDARSTAFCSLFASVPGALLLVVLCMAALLTVQRKMNIIEKSEGEYEIA